MIIPSNNDGFSSADFYEQESASINKRLQPSNPVEFIKWVAQTVRVQRARLNQITGKHRTLKAKTDRATVNLKRLDFMAPFGERFNLDRIKDMHRELTAKFQGATFTLDRCKSVLDETTANYQFVGESLKKGLTDRHKKIAVQKELGLRLRDLDEALIGCDSVITEQNTNADNLGRAVRKLLTRLKAELPPSDRDSINKEDKVIQIARRYGKTLGPNTPNPGRNLGHFSATPAESAPAPDLVPVVDASTLSKPAFSDTALGKAVLLGAGLVIGRLIISKVL
jgi:hypothetical protein